MKGLGPHKPLVSRVKPPLLALVDTVPCSANFYRTTISPSCKFFPTLLFFCSILVFLLQFLTFHGKGLTVLKIGNCGFVVLLNNIMSELCIVRCRKISRLNLSHSTIRAQASNASIGPGDYESKKGDESQIVFGGSPVNDNASKV